MFKKWKLRIFGIETVLDALISVLEKKELLTRNDIQSEITKQVYSEMGGVHINRGQGFTHYPEDDCDPRNYEE